MATVTGESRAVTRDAEPSPDAEMLHSRNGLLAGTTVVSGSARALIVATGMRTEFGRIARLAQTTDDAPSPLQRELSALSRLIAALAVAAGLIVFVIGEALGMSRWANFVFAIGIIVANVPEGLLPTVTLAMAMGARRMARRQGPRSTSDERGDARGGVRHLHRQDRHIDREPHGGSDDLRHRPLARLGGAADAITGRTQAFSRMRSMLS